ncbi:MAG: ABC transporter ATP-binding protein [bacterium]|nr:ABC transporter ATP-binding protein [bacterium]
MTESKSVGWKFTNTIRRLIPYLLPYRRQFTWGVVCVIATNIFGVLTPLVLKYGIEDLQKGITSEKIYYYCLIIVVLALIAGVFRYFMRKVIISISRYIENDLRVEYFAHLQKLPPSFYDRQQTGDLMTRATSDVEAVRMVVGPAIMYSIDTFLTAILSLSLMFALSASLTLTVLALAPILSTLIYFLARNLHKLSLRVQERYSDLNADVQEYLSGIRVVKAYCQEDSERDIFKSLNLDYFAANMKLTKIYALLGPLFMSIFGIGMALILYSGGRAIIAGQMSLGDFVAFSAYVAMLAWPVLAIGWVLNLYQRGSASLQRIMKILETKPDISSAKAAILIEKFRGEIAFDQVNFTYPGTEKPVLQEISLLIPAGSSLGIVGQVGSGKSTLTALIPRLYEVTSGFLTIDGVPIDQIALEQLRQSIAVVPQDSLLFSDQLKENVLFANPDDDETKLLHFAEIAQLSSDVAGFSEGFNSWVGERGITLSGGQKQRTCLARALAVNPQIFIMDDCFSSVDTNTEADILSRLRPELKGKTVLIIAHRISTLQWADQIIVLKEGKISERGTHQQLLRKGGWYKTMHQRQLLEEQIR